MLFGQLPYITCWSGQLPETLSCWTAPLWAFLWAILSPYGFCFGLGQCFYLQIWVLLGCCVDIFATPSIVRCLFWWICWPPVLICVLEHMLDHILIYFVMCWTLLENGIAANVFKTDITLSIVCWRRLLSPILGAILWFNFSLWYKCIFQHVAFLSPCMSWKL